MMDLGTMRSPVAEDSARWSFKKAKLALAIAIIRSRPQGKSGRQHAEALACLLRSQDDALRSKAEGLQEEVIKLRQELLLLKIISKANKMAKTDDFMNTFSEDVMGPEKKMINFDMDSGCGTQTSTETTVTTQESTDGVFEPTLLPVTSGPSLPFYSTQETDPQGRAMLLHMRFLQSLCGLHRLEGEGGLEAAGLGLHRDRSLVADSVCQLVSCVVAACSDSRPLAPHSLLLQASGVAAQAVDHWCSHRQPTQEFVTHMKVSLKELISVLLHKDHLNRFVTQEKLTECLILLGGSSLLKSLLIRHVLSEINRLADHLWHTCRGESKDAQPFEVASYENSFYLFRILEQLLQGTQGPGQEGRPGGIVPRWPEEQKSLLERLERNVLLLSDEFPLFALYMWRIGAFLYPTETSQT